MPLIASLELKRPSSRVTLLGGQAPPVCVHRDLNRGMSENSRCPLDGMDFRRKSGNNQARLVKNLITGPGRILLAQPVTYRNYARERNSSM